MRRPKQRGTPINRIRIAQWAARFPGYRRNVTPHRISDWLRQFAPDDRDVAARVLDCVHFVSHESIERAFKKISERLRGWDRNESRRRGNWRFVAFSRAAGESGDTMLHRWRAATGMTGRKYDRLCIHRSDLLREKLGPDDRVVFLDDFAGTGTQACTGWREVMEELLPGRPTAYLILVAATQIARERIINQTPMRLLTQVELRDEDDVFSAGCQHFTAREKNTLLGYCRRANARHPRGWGDCGLVIVLAHKTPNNSIPILHAEHIQWVGLFPRR